MKTKKLTKKDYEELKKKLTDKYAEVEIAGVIDSLLHSQIQLQFILDKRTKDFFCNEEGEIQYEQKKHHAERAVKIRELELEILEELLINKK